MILERLSELLLAMILTPLMVVVWVVVQRAWSRAFNTLVDTEDALECRGGCGVCGPGGCHNRSATNPDTQPGDS